MHDQLIIPKAEIVDSEIKAAFTKIREAERSIKGQYDFTELRASSFPICPRAYHISRRLRKKHRPLRKERYISESTSLMGTALHLVTQKWFGIEMPEYWYGNYECIYCGRTVRNKYGLQVCKECGREMVYKEFSVRRQKGIPFSGHIDGILRFDDGENYLVDFKGAFWNKIKKVAAANQPILSHFYQTNSYAMAINKGKVSCGDLNKIHKIIIIYIDRGLPHVTWHVCQVTPSKKAFRVTKDLIKAGKQSLKTLQIPPGLCSSNRDPMGEWCPWTSVCFNPKLSQLLSSKVSPELKYKKAASRTLDLILQSDYTQNQP